MTATTDDHRFDGGCLCGAVRFQVTEPLRAVVYCHCEQCRRSSGHFVAATRATDTAIAVTREDGLQWYASSETAKRGFCRDCGSSLFWKRNASQHTSIMAGAFDDKTVLTADRHIYTDDKADYYALGDGLPCFAQAD